MPSHHHGEYRHVHIGGSGISPLGIDSTDVGGLGFLEMDSVYCYFHCSTSSTHSKYLNGKE